MGTDVRFALVLRYFILGERSYLACPCAPPPEHRHRARAAARLPIRADLKFYLLWECPVLSAVARVAFGG